MATHSSILAWRIPGTEEPSGLPSMGSHRVRHGWHDLVAAAAGKPLTCKEMGIPDHLTCLLRNLYAGQKELVRTGYGTTDRIQIGKWVCQGCILSPCLFNLHAEYIMWNPRLGEAQAGIKISGRNINNLRYADDTTLMAESEELKSFLMKEESAKVGLKLNIQKSKIMASSPITSQQIDGTITETLTDFILLGSKITAEGGCSYKIKRHLLLGRKSMTNLHGILRHYFAFFQ